MIVEGFQWRKTHCETQLPIFPWFLGVAKKSFGFRVHSGHNADTHNLCADHRNKQKPKPFHNLNRAREKDLESYAIVKKGRGEEAERLLFGEGEAVNRAK
ncbi:unnamed protein product [Linum trigynum]|uniref:Uncharacterized protein n=1 Tax=Linum trigynum TaxID=586398 RepID=A0AAV2CP94_9ROSI